MHCMIKTNPIRISIYEIHPNKNLKLLMEKDIWASNVYTLGFEYESKANLDYTEKLITYD